MSIQTQYNKIILLEIWVAQETIIFFVYKEAKETILNFSQGTERVF